MKTYGRILRIISWEKRKDYFGTSNLRELIDGNEYDFLLLGRVYDLKDYWSMIKRFFGFWKIDVDQIVLVYNVMVPVKRPHTYKKRDVVEFEFDVKPFNNPGERKT